MALDIFITLLLVFMNGFFVAAEFAIVKVRASQLEVHIKNGNRFAVLSKHIVTHLDGYLAATQLGITLASLALGWIGEPVVSKMIISVMHWFDVELSHDTAHAIALPIAFAIITVLHIVFGELAPKSIAIQRSEGTTLALSYPLQFFYIIFRPFIWILNGIANLILKMLGITSSHGNDVHSSDELKYLVKLGKESGEIGETDYDIIKNAFEFSERTAEEVMVPRTKVVAVDLNDYNEEILEKIIDERFSRIPCFEDNLDHVTGIVHLKDILLAMRKGGKVNLRSMITPIIIIPQNKRIGTLLKEFQQKHQQMAVVVDEYGGTLGIVTMEDILEELVGEIQDETDNEIPFVEQTADKTFQVLASASIDDINDLIPRNIEKKDEYNTLAGYIIDKCGRIPAVNEKFTADGYEITILKKNRTTILLVKLVDMQP
ncbi:MAG: HlyC/CorC family transporter [Crocinitomicaceae bacterium]|nr:HlyC/CorC family transporter [Crocinitomicaceae bacterium]